jgi:aryl sulfotransferase
VKGIVWLASYPKSGNTWLRVFITNLERGGETRASINDLDFVSGSGIRAHFDEAVGYKAGELTHDEVDRLRPDVYVYESHVRDEAFFCKVHDAFASVPDGRPLFPPEASLRAVYIIRNPLDVCVSFAHHRGATDLDAMIESMADPTYAFGGCPHDPTQQLRQRLLTWSGHVLSWVDGARMPLHVMRYEDMKLSPLPTFTSCAEFLGLPHDRERVLDALEKSSFAELQRQEREQGFSEKPPSARSFFREGRVGSWRDELTPQQAARIVRDHRDVMRRFGYLTDAGEPLY